MMNIRRTTAAAAIGLVAVLAAPAAPALATITDGGSYHDTFGGPIADFCGSGRHVTFAGTSDGTYKARPHGPDKLWYYVEHQSVRITWQLDGTNLTAYEIQPNVLIKDQSITDNGDGTLTIIQLLTGGTRDYGHDGKQIASNAGQVRFRIVYDYVNDKDLSRELIFGSTGTNDDFCDAVLADWGLA
jgi:hypothetical protein